MFPERFTVQHEVFTPGVEDSQGNEVDAWAAPVAVRVYGWAPPSGDREIRDTRTGVERDLDLYCRTPFAGPRDRVTIRGERFTVVGHPENYDFGPFGFTPGCRVNLRRVEG